MSVTTVSSKSKTSQRSRAARADAGKKLEPSEEQIRILAYGFYERRRVNGLDGDATSDWVQAEQQLRAEA